MKVFILFALSFIVCQHKLFAQSCKTCNRQITVCHYDFFVVEKQPEKPEDVLAWQQLFWLAKFSQSYIFDNNKNCVRFIDPVASSAYGNRTLVVGITAPALPSSKVSRNIDYIIVGGVVAMGNEYLLSIQLQTSCTQKTIAKSEVRFHSSSDPEYTKAIAEQAAAGISPLAEKINAYAEQKRKEDRNTAFGGWGSESISVVPKTTKLASGQETEVEITLKDCDGMPLANREVDFGKGAVEGFDIKGTSGGTLTPMKVTTDGNGKAKAKFKMGAVKTAFIRAHYIFNRPSGCQDAMIGSCPIGGIPVRVTVFYETSQQQSFDPGMWTPLIKGDRTRETFTRSHVTDMYFFPKDPKSPYLVLTVPEAKAGESIYEMDLGDFSYKGTFPSVSMSIDNGPISVHQQLSRDSVVTNSGSSKNGRRSDITFFLGSEIDPMYFSIDFHCANEDDENEVGTGPFPSDITVSKIDYNTKFTIRKITDPKSPYKTEYRIEMLRDPGSLKEVSKEIGKDLNGIQEITGFRGQEVIAVFILSPYSN